MTSRKISFAQNAEDVRVWRAFADRPTQQGLVYVDVGANEPVHLSITASLSGLGWHGLLVEADPDLAAELRVHRPADVVVEAAAAAGDGELAFYRVPGTGLGTLDAAEADAARARGFEVESVVVPTMSLDRMLDEHHVGEIHFMSIDVEGAEAVVLQGLSLRQHRPWILCVEAVLPGTSTPSHSEWEPALLRSRYRFVAFDGVNRWYVADEHADLAPAVAVPFNAIDAGEHGWMRVDEADARDRADRAGIRRAWQRELILNDVRGEVPRVEYERQIDELRTALVSVEGSRTFALSRRLARIAKGGVGRVRRLRDALPASMHRSLVRRRHLKHVTVNMGHLTDSAYLGSPPPDDVDWITPDGLPAVPRGGLDLGPLTTGQARAAQDWLDAGPYDTDALLDRRTDNHGDELGRTIAALRLRLALAEGPVNPLWAGGNRVLFDARCLQTAAFGARGIGRFARSALLGARDALGDDRLDLLVDFGLEALPEDVAGECRLVTRITERTVAGYSVLVQPSPMTASAEPLLPLLHSNAHKIAIVFDFIPMHYPTVYLRHAAARSEYAAALDALRKYDAFVGISHLALTELSRLLGRPLSGPDSMETMVAWPRDVLPAGERAAPSGGTGPIVVMTGDEPRKNTFGALAGIGAATSDAPERDVVVIGMAGQDDRVHHWSIAAAMRPGEALNLGQITDDEMHQTLADASLVVVASFDEGLSLPVIEALRAGAPVVASDIAAHRELIGKGSYLADPAKPADLAKAIRKHRGRAATQGRQMRRLAAHRHASIESVIGKMALDHVRPAAVAVPPAAVYAGGRALRVGIGTPWVPQRTGVADFSTTTTLELAELCDVTVYTTTDADVPASVPAGVRISHDRIERVLAEGCDDDVFVSVLGNSHFHLPFLAAIERVESVVVCHDTRLVELYLALRGRGGVEQLMLRGSGRRALSPSLDEQIDDMRLLQNAGFWEVARRARLLVMHSESAAPRIARETGVAPVLLPFANQRYPQQSRLTAQDRRAARARLGFDAGPFAGTTHIASFGFVDLRTKMTDVALESAAWLTQWGHRVSLHLVGAAGADDTGALTRRARDAGIANFRITGFLDDADFRDYLQAVDVGLQLRIGSLLGVSGPLSDLAAYGTPSVASSGLAIDVAAPEYVDRLPDDVSPVIVAEAIERRLANPIEEPLRERMRVAYLDRQSPRRYAEVLYELLLAEAALPPKGEG